MKRDILDYLGNVIGEMDLPDDTSEEVWAQKLAVYAVDPNPNALQILDATIKERKEWADDFMQRFKKKNLLENINGMQALWVHHRLRALPVNFTGMDFTIDLLNLVVSGDLECACLALMNTPPDAMDQPFHFLSQERLDWIVKELKDYLHW